MKKGTICIVLVLFTGTCLAQTRVTRFELEGGISLSTRKVSFDNPSFTWSWFAEGRYNFRKKPIDLGLQYSQVFSTKELSGGGSINEYMYKFTYYKWHFKTFQVVGDYNFRQGRDVSPFVGAGVGISKRTSVRTVTFYRRPYPIVGGLETLEESAESIQSREPFKQPTGNSFCVMARVGVEFFHHVRLTADYQFTKKEYSHLAISAGVVLGGGVIGRKR